MRIETGVSRDGCNAKNILRAARKFGMEAKGYKKSLEGLLEMEAPCIIHWNFNHFVVWEGVQGKYAYINDPAMGRRKLTMEELDDCYTGVVLAFQPTESFEKSKKKKTLMSFIKKRLKGQTGTITALFTIGLLMVFPGMVIPVFSQFFIDEIISAGHDDWMSVFLAVMAFTVLFKQGLTYYRGMVLQKFQNKMALTSAHEFLSHMFRLPMSFFDQRYSGDLAQRVDNNNNVSTFLAGELAETVLNIFVAAFYLILLLVYSPLLTLIGIFNVIRGKEKPIPTFGHINLWK
jgi:ABC-type bacteriocin/lantibiotic exporter with double-glycine peptidase domain